MVTVKAKPVASAEAPASIFRLFTVVFEPRVAGRLTAATGMLVVSPVLGTKPKSQLPPVSQYKLRDPSQSRVLGGKIHPGLGGERTLFPSSRLLLAVMSSERTAPSRTRAKLTACGPPETLIVHGLPFKLLIRLTRFLAVPVIVKVP
ncbi:hypothetical protein ES708_11637 [subsurface metagenome]